MINSGRLQYFVQYSSSPYLKPVHIESLSPTMEVAGWVKVSLGFFWVENHPKIALNQYRYFGIVYHIILSVYTLLKIVSYYDLSVLSMSVMGFQKKVWMGVGGWGELYPSFFLIFLIF